MSPQTYPIVNPAVLLNTPGTVLVIQSDASGTDGYGYTSGYLEDTTLTYQSMAWTDADPCPSSSHAGELKALQHAVHHALHTETEAPRLLIWVTDSMAASYSVNKGLARKDEGFAIVEDILATCDAVHTAIVAIWVPREDNTFADTLSHLASSLNRQRVEGTVHIEDTLAD